MFFLRFFVHHPVMILPILLSLMNQNLLFALFAHYETQNFIFAVRERYSLVKENAKRTCAQFNKMATSLSKHSVFNETARKTLKAFEDSVISAMRTFLDVVSALLKMYVGFLFDTIECLMNLLLFSSKELTKSSLEAIQRYLGGALKNLEDLLNQSSRFLENAVREIVDPLRSVASTIRIILPNFDLNFESLLRVRIPIVHENSIDVETWFSTQVLRDFVDSIPSRVNVTDQIDAFIDELTANVKNQVNDIFHYDPNYYYEFDELPCQFDFEVPVHFNAYFILLGIAALNISTAILKELYKAYVKGKFMNTIHRVKIRGSESTIEIAESSSEQDIKHRKQVRSAEHLSSEHRREDELTCNEAYLKLYFPLQYRLRFIPERFRTFFAYSNSFYILFIFGAMLYLYSLLSKEIPKEDFYFSHEIVFRPQNELAFTQNFDFLEAVKDNVVSSTNFLKMESRNLVSAISQEIRWPALSSIIQGALDCVFFDKIDKILALLRVIEFDFTFDFELRRFSLPVEILYPNGVKCEQRFGMKICTSFLLERLDLLKWLFVIVAIEIVVFFFLLFPVQFKSWERIKRELIPLEWANEVQLALIRCTR